MTRIFIQTAQGDMSCSQNETDALCQCHGFATWMWQTLGMNAQVLGRLQNENEVNEAAGKDACCMSLSPLCYIIL